MNNVIVTCDKIRKLNQEKTELLSKDWFLESLSFMALDAVLDYEKLIKGILNDNLQKIDKLNEIRELMKNTKSKEKIEEIIKKSRNNRLEDMSPYFDTLIKILKETGENHD